MQKIHSLSHFDFLRASAPQHQPDVVMVECDDYIGPLCFKNYPRVVPIVPVKRLMEYCCYGCK